MKFKNEFPENEKDEDHRPTVEEQEFWDDLGKFIFIAGGVMILILYILDKLNLLPFDTI